VSRAPVIAIAGLALLLAVASCGGGGDDHGGGGAAGKPMTLDWDFTDSHTLDDVDWPADERDLDAVDLRPIASLRFRFPGGREFTAGGDDVLRVNPARDGRTIEEVLVVSHPQTVDDAYRLSTRWARDVDIPTRALERWHAAGGTGRNVSAYDTRNTRLGGGRGPVPDIKLISSFDDRKPISVTLTFFWPRAQG
jgi:hypothetical protein